MFRPKPFKAIYDRQLLLWMVLGILLLSLSFSWVTFSAYVGKLEAGAQGHSLVDYLNASAQRLVKLELLGDSNDELIFNLDNTILEITENDDDYFDGDTAIMQAISDVASDWDATEIALYEYRLDDTSVSLISSSERLFYHAASLSILSTDYISNLSAVILRLELLILLQLLAIAAIITRHLILAFQELKRNRALSASMFIDAATGLYNRSKCHEVLRATTSTDDTRAVVVFDLNDLKKTNDVYGHRVGDELIYSFAQLIKEATKIHTKDVFIGRYGGDEFMVYYHQITQDEIRLYLEEVSFLAEAFNEKETRFQISYAAGRAVAPPAKKSLTLRQLFDIADQDMYRNKAEMKKNQAAARAAAQGIPAFQTPEER